MTACQPRRMRRVPKPVADVVPNCGNREMVAAYLGVSRQNVHQLSDFPPPDFRFGKSDVWLWATVDDWSAGRGYKSDLGAALAIART